VVAVARKHSWLALVAAATALAAWFHYHYLLKSIGPFADEAWMTQVVARMQQGETLYRDIFCGTTPLAFYIQAALGTSEVSLLRSMLHILFVATVVLTTAIGWRLEISKPLLIAGTAALVVWIRPMPNSLYSNWALLFLLAALFCCTWLLEESPVLIAIAAGALAGLSFAAKHNVGLLALAAVLGAIAVLRRPGWQRQAAGAMGAFAVTITLACLLPIAWSGAWSDFVSQCFTGKSVYLREARVGYFDQWQGWSPTAVIYLLPVALPVLFWIAFRQRPTAAPILLFVFACAGLLAVYPRPDLLHMRLSVPALTLAAVYCLAQGKWPYRLHRMIAILACCAAATYYLHQARKERANGPHYALKQERLRGISMNSLAAGRLIRESEAMERQNAPNLFILHPHAAVYYLATGIRNPTRYDFPLSTTFGPHGQQQVIDRIRSGDISAVCLQPTPWEILPPQALIGFIQQNLRPGPDLGPCRIFSR
jgi:hypothetical protein